MLKIKKIEESGPKLKGLRGRGIDRATCEELGGKFVQIGSEKVCFIEETKLKDGKIIKKADVEIIDVGEVESRRIVEPPG